MKGILDRFEGDNAVILIEEEKAEIIRKKAELPSGSDVNTIFQIEKDGEDYRVIEIDASATSEAKDKSSLLMKKLRAKSSGSKFKRN